MLAALNLVPPGAVALAWCLDAAFGEPRDRWHPVAWLGRLAAPLGRCLPKAPPAPAFIAGAAAWAAIVGLAAGAGWGLQRLVDTRLPAGFAAVALALALKPAFAWRMLRDEVGAVEAAFAHGLPAARARVARLCSRPVDTLDAVAVRETAVETLAENLNDSLVAPLFWFAVAGLPGAWAWRAVNTLDAMWGYRGAWEWAGKCAARADDLLAWLPARLTAALLWRPGVPLGRLRQEAARTPSPNGGWPMAALALRLGVRLTKPGVYRLNEAGAEPGSAQVRAALRATRTAAWQAALLAALSSAVLGSVFDSVSAFLGASASIPVFALASTPVFRLPFDATLASEFGSVLASDVLVPALAALRAALTSASLGASFAARLPGVCSGVAGHAVDGLLATASP